MPANNSLTAAALTLGVEAEDLAKVLPALQAAKELRSKGITVRINPTEAWEPIPRLNPGVALVTVDLHLTTYRETTIAEAWNEMQKDKAAPAKSSGIPVIDTLAKAFFGPK